MNAWPCFLLALFISVAQGSAGDWPRWRGPDLNGVSRETGWTTAWPREGPKQLWKASVGTGFSSVSVAQGRLFTLGNKNETDTVYCFDAETGKELWKHSYPCPIDPKYYEGGPGATPTVDGDHIYTLSKRGHLFCFAAASGKVIWQKNLIEELGVKKPEWGLAGSPLVRGDLIVLNVGTAGTAVDKATGRVVWKSGTDASGYATPVPFTFGELAAAQLEPAVAIFSGKALHGVRLKDGHELWRHPWVTRWDINAADPIFIDADKLFISTFDRGCALLQLTTAAPKVVWQNKNIANHFNSCVFLNGYLYGVHGNTDQAERDLRCLEASSGELKWKYEGLGLGSLMAADGKLIVLSDRGELVVAEASPESFKPLARAQVLGGKCWTVPVLAQGRLYCRNAQGTLICLDLREPSQSQ
jgi:outer membrane protein assembly factor BamB